MNLAVAVQRQRDFFKSGATRSFEFRRDQLRKLEESVLGHEDELADALYSDLRKSASEAYTTETGIVLSEIHNAIRRLPSWMKSRKRRVPLIAWPGRAFIEPEPMGVALIVGPWNYPAQLVLSPLAGAIAAGNCAIIKPSELAPHTAGVVAKLVEAVFPAEYITVIQGDQEVSKGLLREKFDTIFFTGSTSVGRAVMAAAAERLTPVTLELGGKSPCIVCGDAPLEATARRIVWGKFMNAGQTCVAPDYVLVDARARDGLVNAVKAALRDFYGDNPQQSPDYSRVVNRRHFQRLIGYLDGGRVVHGGQYDAEDLYIAPTLLTGVRLDAPVMTEEIFGPILPIIDFNFLDDVFSLLRERPVPLALYLFTRDRGIQRRVLDGTRSGGVCLNDVVMHIVNNQLPFGGLGESGMGSYHGKASFECFTHQRSVLRRGFAFEHKLRYPPPAVELAKLKRVFRFLLGG